MRTVIIVSLVALVVLGATMASPVDVEGGKAGATGKREAVEKAFGMKHLSMQEETKLLCEPPHTYDDKPCKDLFLRAAMGGFN